MVLWPEMLKSCPIPTTLRFYMSGVRDGYVEKKYCFIKWACARSGASGKESACQGSGQKRCGFNPCIGKIPWRRKWQPTLVFLPGEFHGQMSLEDYSPWGCKELDTTEGIHTHTHTHTHARARARNPILSVFTKQGWRRKWQPTPVFLPRESRGQRNLTGYIPWGCKSRTQLSN